MYKNVLCHIFYFHAGNNSAKNYPA